MRVTAALALIVIPAKAGIHLTVHIGFRRYGMKARQTAGAGILPISGSFVAVKHAIRNEEIQMRIAALSLVAAAALAASALAANAAPAAPSPDAQPRSNIVKAVGGCSWGFHPKRWHRCVPDRYGYYRARPYWRGYYGGGYYGGGYYGGGYYGRGYYGGDATNGISMRDHFSGGY